LSEHAHDRPRPDGAFEEPDALPVPAGVRALEAPEPETVHALAVRSPVPMQVAAVATGFVAGAATVAMLQRRRARRALRESRRGRRSVRGDGLSVLGSRSFLVDVHLLGGGGD